MTVTNITDELVALSMASGPLKVIGQFARNGIG